MDKLADVHVYYFHWHNPCWAHCSFTLLLIIFATICVLSSLLMDLFYSQSIFVNLSIVR